MTYLSWGTYRRFAGCGYSLGKALTREARVLFSHHPKGLALCRRLTPGGRPGPRNPTKSTVGPQVGPNWSQARQEAGNVTPNVSKMAPKGDLGRLLGSLWEVKFAIVAPLREH